MSGLRSALSTRGAQGVKAVMITSVCLRLMYGAGDHGLQLMTEPSDHSDMKGVVSDAVGWSNFLGLIMSNRIQQGEIVRAAQWMSRWYCGDRSGSEMSGGVRAGGSDSSQGRWGRNGGWRRKKDMTSAGS